MDFFDFCWMYAAHIGLWYFLNVFYKLGYHIVNREPLSSGGRGWFWGIFIGFFSLLFHFSLYKVGYAPFVIK